MFQAPDTDTAPETGGFKAPDSDDDAPKWSDLPKNIIPDAENMLKGSAQTALRIGKGIADIPSDVIETGKEELNGGSPLNTPIAQDVKTVGEGALNAVKGIPRSLMDLASKDAWIQHPVGNAVTVGGIAAPFLAPEAEAGEAAAKVGAIKPPASIEGSEFVPHETIPAATPASAPVVPPPEAPKGLPIIEPGAKTGDPHALFAYNDKFGPGGAERSIYNVFGDPEHPAIKARGWGSSVSEDDLQKAGIPITGRAPSSAKYTPIPKTAEPDVVPMGGKEPAGDPVSRMPPDPNAPPPKPETNTDPLKDVKDWLSAKGQKVAEKPGIVQKLGNYLDEESVKLGGKDIGLNLGQLKGMGSGFEGLEKGKALIDYAREKGYLSPTLSDNARKAAIKTNMETAGAQLGALRDIGNKRGVPPVEAMRSALQTQLTDKFGLDAPGEINKVLAKFDKAAKTPTFTGMADLATDLHAEKQTASKMGLHPGPTTEGANIIAHMNNDALRGVLNPEESNMFTKSLSDFGAHKKLEQAVSSRGRKELVGRGAPGSATNRVIQELLDRGGYRLGGNIANRVAKWTKANPGATLPQFFEQLAHQSNDVVDDTIHGMAKGGVVPNDIKQWITARGC